MPIKKKSIVSAMSAATDNKQPPMVLKEPPVGLKHESMKKGTSIFKS